MSHRSPHPADQPGKAAAAALLVLVFSPLLAGCSEPSAEAAANEAVHIVKVGSVNEITLTARSAERLGIATGPVARAGTPGRLTIPHGALLYDADGGTFVYVNPDGLVFKRAEVTVVTITGVTVILSAGPAVGTKVVTTGAAELFGVDTGVGGGH
jgi:hypothetical protein